MILLLAFIILVIELGSYLYGCMDEEAENYDSESDFDDGSCSYTIEVPIAVYALPSITSVTPSQVGLQGMF